MKSSQEVLRKRGMASEKEIASQSGSSLDELLICLHNNDACMRTAAAVNLAPFVDLAAEDLLMQLAKERSLYTKIAICECLEQGNPQTARLMSGYLGQIGKNQHQKLPQKVSAKISFPLPRDIIARSMGKMDLSILPVLIEVIEGEELAKICEALDAIGYMVFYHPALAAKENLNPILSMLSVYGKEPLVLWKTLLCLSAFPLPESRAVLMEFEEDQTVLGMEARRSLALINKGEDEQGNIIKTRIKNEIAENKASVYNANDR